MDISDQIRLARNRNELRETVVFKYIAAHLLRDNVINSEEFQLISVKETKQAQIDALLQLLNTKSHEAFLSFVSSLEENYHWLVENLRKSVSAQEVASFQQCVVDNKKAVTDQNENHINDCESEKLSISLDMISVLQQNARLVRRWTSLAYR